ncbi:mannosyltransferase [Pseudomonas putida]|uniref:dermonecrotic toxin domain-containing protein n=1 Tax=Pseudomonas putida TaxID=303 RepID=UPI002160D326|nr:DUF6543 domain-containing protein [Pseudomonas putida]UVL77142.1 mannosyltransferase [Pseudomonas putida]
MRHIPQANLGLVRQALQDFPRPDQLAEQTLRKWLEPQGIAQSPLEIDVLTFHYQLEPQGEGRTRFQENAVISQQMNLVEALLGNWQGEPAAGYSGFHYGNWAGLPPRGPLTLVERLEPPSELSNASPYLVFNGLYRRTQPPRYAPDTRLPIRAESFQAYLWSLSFLNNFKQSLDAYWDHHLTDYQKALRIAFIAACNQQMLEGSLSDTQRQLAWRAAGLLPRGDLRLSMLNVYGYSATDILQIRPGSGPEVLLYIPGNASPFHGFADESALQHWFAAQCQEAHKREALLAHFARADWPDGLDFSGLRTALSGLGLYPRPHRFSARHPGFATSGFWNPTQIIGYRPETYSPPITTDLFEYLALLRQDRTYADADAQITSNHDINKARWSSYLQLASAILAPLVIVLPELTPLLIGDGLAQFSLGLDQAINGKSLGTKADGAANQAFGLFNALPTAANAIGRPAAVFRYTRPGFFSPARLSELLGAPIGAAPEAPALDSVEMAFREQAVVSNTTGALVTRVDENLRHRFMAWLQARDGLVSEWVEYEFSSDSFIRSRDNQWVAPPRWRVANEGDTALSLSTERRVATDQQRMATLHALGIDLDLPVDYSLYTQQQTMPLAKLISSVWVGDQPLQGQFLETLVHNAQVARASGYRLQIFLSRQHPASYELNLRTLGARAEGAQVLTLEHQGFFQEFSRSVYYPQYLDALHGKNGVGRNFASACDILRYRLLRYYGGLYLDADDRLLSASAAEARPPLANCTLQVTPDGLLLAPPVSNDQLGMYIKFNSSMIASHPNNPTLDAISDEILRRYHLAPDFYHSRPDPKLQPLPFQAYARRLNLISGPGALNDVIDARLPLLRQLREICHLLVSPVYDLHATLNLRQFSEVLREQVPLDRIAHMGQQHSWAFPDPQPDT